MRFGALLACVVLAGCFAIEEPPGNTPSPTPVPSDNAFHVIVSNQSFDRPDTRIRVYVDGALAFDQVMNVGDQHTWDEVIVAAPSGPHYVKAQALHPLGTVTTELDVVSTGEHWVSVAYWEGGQDAGYITAYGSDEPFGFD